VNTETDLNLNPVDMTAVIPLRGPSRMQNMVVPTKFFPVKTGIYIPNNFNDLTEGPVVSLHKMAKFSPLHFGDQVLEIGFEDRKINS
jgi:hypothetical protein